MYGTEFSYALFLFHGIVLTHQSDSLNYFGYWTIYDNVHIFAAQAYNEREYIIVLSPQPHTACHSKRTN